jgi:hypothetical protein
MLDKEVFATLLDELAAYHKKDISPFVQRVFYKHLSQSLNTAQFEQAIEMAFIKCKSMPTPEEIAELAGTGQKIHILDQWQRIEQGRKAFPTAPDATKEYGQLISSLKLDAVALKALKTLGGLSALSRLSDQDIKWSRQQFIEYYQLFDSQRDQLELEAEAIRALAATAEKPALPPSSAEPIPEEVAIEMQSLIGKMSQKMTMPEPVKAVGTAEEYQAIAKELVNSWRTSGQLSQELEF